MAFLTHNDLRLTHHRVSLAGIPVDGGCLTPTLRLIQLSDLHFYEHSDLTFFQCAWDMVYKATDDAAQQGLSSLVCITGDTIHKGPHFVDLAGEWLAKLPKPAVAILGNHDYEDGSKSQAVQTMMSKAGVQLLIHQAIPLHSLFPHNTTLTLPTPLWLAGLDDYYAGQRSINAAFENIPNNASVIALAHNPLHWNELKNPELKTKQPQLVLSGHTHAGQVYIPLLWPIYRYVLNHQYRYGWYQEQVTPNSLGSRLYVSSGVSSVAFYPRFFGKPYPLPPFRWNTWPEVAVIDVALGL